MEALLADARVDPAIYGAEPLREASRYGHVAVVKLLLADKRVLDNLPFSSAPSIAIRRKHFDIADLLLSATSFGASEGRSATLRTAARFGCSELLGRIVADPRADPSAMNNEALRDAAANGHAEVVARLLADARVDPTAHASAALRLAARNGHAPVIAHLVADRRADAAANGNAALLDAAQKGHTEVVRLLLADERVNPNVARGAALRSATRHESPALLDVLLADARLTPTAVNAALCDASRAGNAATVAKLLAHPKTDPAARGSLALLLASQYCHAAVVDSLLTDGRADPMAQGGAIIYNAGLAPLPDHPRAFKYLDYSQVEPWAKDYRRVTIASEETRVAVMSRLLQDPRVDPAVADSRALRTASLVPHLALVQRLLADGRVQPARHKDAVLAAVLQEGNMLMFEQLLSDPRFGWSVKDDGSSTLKMAARHGRAEAVAKLLSIDGWDLAGDHRSWYAATAAASNGRWDIVDMLLARPDYCAGNHAVDLLTAAAGAGKSAVVLRVLETHPDVYLEGPGNYCLWASAIKAGRVDTLSFLLSHRADRMDPPDAMGCLVIWAAADAQPSILEFLLVHPRVYAVPYLGKALAAMLRDCVNEDMSTLRLIARRLLSFADTEPNEFDNAAIAGAARLGFLDIVERLLADPRVDPAAGDNAALHAAAMHGQDGIVSRLLADPRVSPVSSKRDVVHDAAAKGRLSAARLLMADGRIDRRGGLASLAAGTASRGDADAFAALVDEFAEAGALDVATQRSFVAAAAANRLPILLHIVTVPQLRAFVTPAVWADALIAAAGVHVDFVEALLIIRVGDESEVARAVCRALCAAVSGDHTFASVKNVEQLLNFLASVSDTVAAAALASCGDPPLLGSVRRNNCDASIVRMMLVDPRISRRGALFAAAGAAKWDAVTQLLADEQVDPSAEGSLVLALAVRNNHDSMVKKLLADPRIDPSLRSGELLWFAAEQHDSSVLRILLDDPRIDATAMLHSGPWPYVGSPESAGKTALMPEDAERYFLRRVSADLRAVHEAQTARNLSRFEGDPLRRALGVDLDGSDPEVYERALPLHRDERYLSDRVKASRLFFSCTAVLNARLHQAERQPIWLDVMRRVGSSAEMLSARAWRRRAQVIAARQWVLAGHDRVRPPNPQTRKPKGLRPWEKETL